MEDSALHDRLSAICDGQSFRELAELTGSNPETVRRYMAGQSPSVEFLTRLCQRKGINGQWLLNGQGPMKSADIRSATLREAGPGELMSAMAVALETLRDRVDRLERFVHTLETRLRVAQSSALGQTHREPQYDASTPEQPKATRIPAHEHNEDPLDTRAARIAGAITQRPRESAR